MAEPIYRNPPTMSRTVGPKTLAQTIDWSLTSRKIPAQWAKATGDGVRVAVLDTGCELDHPDLVGQIEGAEDFSGSRWGAQDRNDHGTWCAGMIAAVNNDVGTVGVAPQARLLIGKVLGDSGSGSTASVVAGIDWAREQGAHVVSMSLGSPHHDPRELRAIQRYLADARPGDPRYVITAAGNDGNPAGTDSVNYPAKYTETIAVAAVCEDGRRADFSSRGPAVDIAAPGCEMISTITGHRYGRMSGTSMATPFVAGVVALAISSGMNLGDTDRLRMILGQNAVDIGAPGEDEDTGWGLIDPATLLEAPAPGGQDPEANEWTLGPLTFRHPVYYRGESGLHISLSM